MTATSIATRGYITGYGIQPISIATRGYITIAISVPTILPQYSGAGLWGGRKLNEKKVVDRKINYEVIDDDNDVLTIVAFLINIQNGGIR